MGAATFIILPSHPSHPHALFSHSFSPSYTTLTSWQRRTRPSIVKATNDDNNVPVPPPSEQASPPPEAVEIRFRRGSRRRARLEEDGSSLTTAKLPLPPKDWESMSLGEKAVELYMGEKGMLFWLNKFAYASIFIVIGGWILFRFVGPYVGLYQLDSTPLSPTSLFKGS